jgi:hypothetical protein
MAQNEALRDRRMKRILIATSMLLTLSTPSVAHEDTQLWQAIERLEARIAELEGRKDEAAPPPLAVQPSAPPATPEQAQSAATPSPPAPPAAQRQSQVQTRYWLGEVSPFAGDAPSPLREGRMPLPETLVLAPGNYGLESNRLFDPYLDPSRYPVVALAIEGELLIPAAGSYTLAIRATPPREVGGAGNVQVAVTVRIGDLAPVELPLSDTLAKRDYVLDLPASRQPLRIEILARSPGFGPSPARTRVYLGLQAQGAISPVPLRDYLAQ